MVASITVSRTEIRLTTDSDVAISELQRFIVRFFESNKFYVCPSKSQGNTIVLDYRYSYWEEILKFENWQIEIKIDRDENVVVVKGPRTYNRLLLRHINSQ
jgi:hypothetical protein